MKIKRWIKENTFDLKGKNVAITGASGDLGREACYILASLNANLILINRNKEKSERLKKEIMNKYPLIKVQYVIVDLEDFSSVKSKIIEINNYKIDYLILNAGAYKIERRKSDLEYDNVFQINFVSQYYIARKLLDSGNCGKLVAVSSIAHSYSKIDIKDIDFIHKKSCSKVYGNSKRFLMGAIYELFKSKKNSNYAVVHPGISFTNITSHYSKWLFFIIKYPMKIIFSKPKKAALSIIKGVFDNCEYNEWIGPKYFNIWGYPKLKEVSDIQDREYKEIFNISELIYNRIEIYD